MYLKIACLFSFGILLLSCNKNSDFKNTKQKPEFIDMRTATLIEKSEFKNIAKSFYGIINKIDSGIDTTNIQFEKLMACKVDNKMSEVLIIELTDNSRNMQYALAAPILNSKPTRPILESVSEDRILKYYDLENLDIFTLIFNGNNLNIEKRKTFALESELKSTTSVVNSNRCSWQGVNDCIQDAYSNHGFISTWLWIQSAYLPHTAAAIGAFCIMENVKCGS